jgi:hypothetical protein
MFRPLYRPPSGCILSYCKANCTIYNVFVFVDEVSCTSIKFAFKIITVAVELKSYSNIKGVNSIKKAGCCDLEGGGGVLCCQTGDIPVWQCWFLCLDFRSGTVNWLPGSAVMVNYWKMFRGGRSPTVVVVLISRWLLKYMYCVVQVEIPDLKCCYCIVECLFRMCGYTE